MTKALLLDSDGVIYPTKELSLRCIIVALKEAANAYDITRQEWLECSAQNKAKDIHGMTNFMQELCNYKGIPFDDFCKQHASKISYSTIKPNPELYLHLQQMHDTGFKIAVASNNHDHHIRKVLDQVLGNTWDNLGIDIISGTTFQHNGHFLLKPSAEYFKESIKHMDIPVEQTILIDDTKENITQAAEQNIHAIHLTKDKVLTEVLEALKPYGRVI